MYPINDLGRAYRFNARGKMVPVPGTEGSAFQIPYEGNFAG